jgi:hypothetical protein
MQRHHKHEVTRWQAVNKKAQPFSGQAKYSLAFVRGFTSTSAPLADDEEGGSKGNFFLARVSKVLPPINKHRRERIEGGVFVPLQSEKM